MPMLAVPAALISEPKMNISLDEISSSPPATPNMRLTKAR
jgi:hypothetical protein